MIPDDVSITHLNFGEDFTAVCEQKQVTQQDAERAKFLVMKREQERIASIIRTEREAKSAKLVSEAIKTYGSWLLEVWRNEAAKNIAESLSKSENVTYLPAETQICLISN